MSLRRWTHLLAVRELRQNYTRKGVWVYLRHYGLLRFLLHPHGAYVDGVRASEGIFT